MTERMTPTTSLLTVGFQAGDLASDSLLVTGLPESASPGRMAWLLNKTGGRGGRSPHAIAVMSDRAPAETVRRVETLRAALPEARLAIHRTALPPLAAGALASVAASMADVLEAPGVLFAALGRIEKEIVTLAWTDRVAALRHVGTSMAQNAIAMVPGTSFGVSLTPEPVVRRLTRKDLAVPVPETRGPLEVVVAGRESNPEWVADFVEPAFVEHAVRDVELPEGSPAWWGTRRVVEVVAYPTDARSLVGRVTRGLRRSSCGWCGEAIASAVCPFCRQPRKRSPIAIGGAA
jgi:hypothetical protein